MNEVEAPEPSRFASSSVTILVVGIAVAIALDLVLKAILRRRGEGAKWPAWVDRLPVVIFVAALVPVFLPSLITEIAFGTALLLIAGVINVLWNGIGHLTRLGTPQAETDEWAEGCRWIATARERRRVPETCRTTPPDEARVASRDHDAQPNGQEASPL